MSATQHSPGPTDPTTPQSSLRARNAGSTTAGDSGSSDASPTSTYSGSTNRTFRLNNATFQTGFSTPSTPARRPLLRTDPALLTCFDPADKELYDLWAPKR